MLKHLLMQDAPSTTQDFVCSAIWKNSRLYDSLHTSITQTGFRTTHTGGKSLQHDLCILQMCQKGLQGSNLQGSCTWVPYERVKWRAELQVFTSCTGVMFNQTPSLSPKTIPGRYSASGETPWRDSSRLKKNFLWKANSAKTASCIANLQHLSSSSHRS